MKTSSRAALVALALAVVCSARADYRVWDDGRWPKSWPNELEPLRKGSSTWIGGMLELVYHHIPFTKREDFESAWPHLLKVKTPGAPIVLTRAPYKGLARVDAGVVVHGPADGTEDEGKSATPLPGTSVTIRWRHTTYLELIVDGKVVDLNRIALPADTPIIDSRFDGESGRSPRRGGE